MDNNQSNGVDGGGFQNVSKTAIADCSTNEIESDLMALASLAENSHRRLSNQKSVELTVDVPPAGEEIESGVKEDGPNDKSTCEDAGNNTAGIKVPQNDTGTAGYEEDSTAAGLKVLSMHQAETATSAVIGCDFIPKEENISDTAQVQELEVVPSLAIKRLANSPSKKLKVALPTQGRKQPLKMQTKVCQTCEKPLKLKEKNVCSSCLSQAKTSAQKTKATTSKSKKPTSEQKSNRPRSVSSASVDSGGGGGTIKEHSSKKQTAKRSKKLLTEQVATSQSQTDSDDSDSGDSDKADDKPIISVVPKLTIKIQSPPPVPPQPSKKRPAPEADLETASSCEIARAVKPLKKLTVTEERDALQLLCLQLQKCLLPGVPDAQNLAGPVQNLCRYLPNCDSKVKTEPLSHVRIKPEPADEDSKHSLGFGEVHSLKKQLLEKREELAKLHSDLSRCLRERDELNKLAIELEQLMCKPSVLERFNKTACILPRDLITYNVSLPSPEKNIFHNVIDKLASGIPPPTNSDSGLSKSRSLVGLDGLNNTDTSTADSDSGLDSTLADKQRRIKQLQSQIHKLEEELRKEKSKRQQRETEINEHRQEKHNYMSQIRDLKAKLVTAKPGGTSDATATTPVGDSKLPPSNSKTEDSASLKKKVSELQSRVQEQERTVMELRRSNKTLSSENMKLKLASEQKTNQNFSSTLDMKPYQGSVLGNSNSSASSSHSHSSYNRSASERSSDNNSNSKMIEARELVNLRSQLVSLRRDKTDLMEELRRARRGSHYGRMEQDQDLAAELAKIKTEYERLSQENKLLIDQLNAPRSRFEFSGSGFEEHVKFNVYENNTASFGGGGLAENSFEKPVEEQMSIKTEMQQPNTASIVTSSATVNSVDKMDSTRKAISNDTVLENALLSAQIIRLNSELSKLQKELKEKSDSLMHAQALLTEEELKRADNDEIRSLRARNEDLSRRLSKATTELQSLKQQRNPSSTSNGTSSAEGESTEPLPDSSELQQQLTGYRGLLDALQSQNVQLSLACKIYEEAAAKNNHQIEELKVENERLKGLLAKADVFKTEVERLILNHENQMKEIRAENVVLKQRLMFFER